MKVSAKTIRQANAIANKYCSSRIFMKEIQPMYAELEAIGITTGMLSGDQRSCEWYYLGEEVENSLFVYSVYKPESSFKVEFTIYFS